MKRSYSLDWTKLGVRVGALVGVMAVVGAGLSCGSSGSSQPTVTHLPDLVYSLGPIIQNPRVVPIFWQTPAGATDPDQANIIDFDTWLLSNPVWIDMVGEYTDSNGNHVGAGTVTAPIIIGTAPTSLTDKNIKDMVDAGTSTGGWPAPDPNTIYTFYLDPTTSSSSPSGVGCQSYGGYHNISSKGFYYAVVLRCANNNLPFLSQATIVSTHEIGESSTDANPPEGYVFAPFNIANEGEDGDLCAWQTAIPDGTHVVQRMFSNKENDLGHDPCVPAPSGVYANVVINPDAITVSASSGPTSITITPYTNGQVQGTLNIAFYSPGLNFQGPTNISPTDTNVTYQVSATGGFGRTPINIWVTQADGTTSTAYAAAQITQ
jgi:hypothetical protein